MADGNADWGLFQAPATSLLGGLNAVNDTRIKNQQAAAEAQQNAFQQQQNQAAIAQTQRTQAALPGIADRLNAGDYSGAQIAAAVTGNKDLATTIDSLQDRHVKALGDYAGAASSTAQGLLSIPAGANGDLSARQAAFDSQIPVLKAHGATDAQLAQERANLSDDALHGWINSGTTVQQQTDNALNARKQTFEENKPVDVGPGSSLVNPTTMQAGYTAPFKPEVLLASSPSGGQVPITVDFNGGGAGNGAPTQSPASVGIARPQRNNNPGNVKALPNGQQWRGQTGVDPDGFAIFGNPQDGARAADRNLASYGRQGVNTIQSIVSRWAPPGDRNNTAQYVQKVSQALGVPPTQPLNLSDPAVRQSLLQKGIFSNEGPGSPSAAAPQGQATPQQGAGGVQLTYGQPVGAPLGSAGATGGLTQGALDLATDEAIQAGGKVPPGYARNKAAQVAILNNMAARAQQQGLTVPQMIQMGQTNKSQGSAFQAWNSGKPNSGAAATRSLSVAVDHIDQLGIAAQALQNGNVPLFNRISQAYSQQTGNAPPTNFAAMKNFVLDEVNKSIIGAGGGVGDREKASQILSNWNSPAQTTGAIAALHGLMAGQLNGLHQQFKITTGRDNFNDYVSPRALQMLQLHGAPSSAVPPDIQAILKKYGH